MAKIPVIEEDPETGWSEWLDVTHGIRLLCCDCLLAHDVELNYSGGKTFMRVSRNNISTAAARRKKKRK
mgnify:CR=1 FL=1